MNINSDYIFKLSKWDRVWTVAASCPMAEHVMTKKYGTEYER